MSDVYPEGLGPTHVPPGWDEWYAHIEEGTKYYNYRLSENGEVVSYGNGEEDYNTDVLARRATEYVGRKANDPQPFFITWRQKPLMTFLFPPHDIKRSLRYERATAAVVQRAGRQ